MATDHEAVHAEAEELIRKHGLIAYHEENTDLPEESRFEWIVIARDADILADYLALRDLGDSPAKSLKPFEGVLSYQPEKAVYTGYDAYRELFPR